MSREGEGSRGLKLTSLKFDAIPGPESVLMFLLQDCDITRLKELSLPRCRLHDADLVRMLADAKPLLAASGLVVLDLSHNPLTDHAAHTLAASDWPPGFRRLNIDGTRISNAGREVLFRRFGFEELRPRLALS